MSDCCSPSSGFPSAATMQQFATNNVVVWEEICKIQQAILAASSQCQVGGGQMCTIVAGNTPMTFVTGVSAVNVTSGGSGYFIDRPAVKFISPLGGPGTGATGTLTTNGGNILSIAITAGGTGYSPIPATLSVSTLAGTGADLEPLVNASGQIIGVNIVAPGTGYTTSDVVSATRAVAPNAAYVNATFQITSVGLGGEILGVSVIIPGSGYQNSVAEVQIVSTLNSLLPYPLGTGFMGTVITDGSGVITQVIITNTGAGYANFSPYLVITDPGTGATTTVTLSGTAVSAIAVNTPGTNYTQLATGVVMNPPTAALPNPPASPAVVDIVVNENTYGTTPGLYWQVWAGVTTNKPISTQLNAVLSYFKALGYTILIQTNPATGSTIQWKVCW